MNSPTSNCKRKTFSSSRGTAVDEGLDPGVDDDVFVPAAQISGEVRRTHLMKYRSHSFPDGIPDLLKNIKSDILTSPDDDAQNVSSNEHARTLTFNPLLPEPDGKTVGNPKKVIHRSKSVHFEATEDKPLPISDHGQEVRQEFRNLKSSGYGTGESSLQSQVSQKSDFSDSFTTSISSGMENKDFGSHDLPNLSIFQSFGKISDSHTVVDSNNESFSVSDQTMFEKTSGGSLRLAAGVTCFEEADCSSVCVAGDPGVEAGDPGVEAEDSPSPPLFKLYDEKILEESMQKGACRVDRTSTGAARLLTDIALMQLNDKQNLVQFLLEGSDLATATTQHWNDLASVIQQILSDSSTPPYHSVSPHTVSQFVNTEILCKECPNTDEVDRILQDLFMNECMVESDVSAINFDLKRNVERAYQCQDLRCRDASCCQIKKLINDFKTTVSFRHQLKPTDVQLLYSLRAHSERCDSLKCDVPWCEVLNNIDPWVVSEAITEISNDCEGPTMTLCDDSESAVHKLLFFDDRFGSGSFREGKDWFVLSPLTETGRVVLGQDLQPGRSTTFVVKKAVLLDYDLQWRVFENLRGLSWKHIVKHHWVMEQATSLLICTEFHHDGTLLHYVEKHGPLQPVDVASFMRQIIEGVRALHLRQILYLYWTSCNMLLVNNKRVKISNLSVSVKLDENEDYSEVKRCLPAVILPPEFLKSSPQLTLASDSWGCGCLTLELLSGKRVWHDIRHCSQEEIWSRLSRRASPPVPASVGHLADVLDSCWKIEQNHRKSLPEIQQMLR